FDMINRCSTRSDFGVHTMHLSMSEKLCRFGIPAAITIALLLPLLFGSYQSSRPFHFGLPRAYSGDEVHYLIMINSLIHDGDLDLANNYAAVHAGAEQAGRHWRGGALDHHTVWFERGERRIWWNPYQCVGDHDAGGHPVPRLRDGQRPLPLGQPEFALHPPGLALLLAPVLLPFRDTQYVEPLAMVCSAIAVICAMFM